jgi:hypothetical protein
LTSKVKAIGFTVLVFFLTAMMCIPAVLSIVVGPSFYFILIMITSAIFFFLFIGIFFIKKGLKKRKTQEVLFHDGRVVVEHCPMCGMKLSKDITRGAVCKFCGKALN